MSHDSIETDICVIGAGSGGLSVASGAVQMGARVVLIEAGEMGGDCLNYGCVPSKALIGAARRAQQVRQGGPGVAGQEPRIDFGAVKDHVSEVISTIAPHDSQERFETLGCTVIRAHARFTGPRELQAGATRVRARRFVIATGSSPMVPPIDGIEGSGYLTNETIFELRDAPGHLLIIGGGPIGLEMAQAHRRLGCEVTVIEGQKALAKDDPALSKVVLEQLRAEGVTILEESPALKIERDGDRVTVVTEAGRHGGTHLLVAAGRRINIGDLGLEAAGVDHDKAVHVGADLRSVSNRHVYAVGDAAGGMQFTHVAGYHAGIVIRSAVLGLPAKAKAAHLPWVTYTDPELAHVGLTEAQAREEHGGNIETHVVPMDGNDRAVATGQTAGLLKLVVLRGRPIGASIVGAHAGELIGMWAMAIVNRQKMSAIAGTVLPYPTLSELNKRGASAYFSPRLFDNSRVKTIVGLIQKYLP
ncbi:dihydrolipoyl dehydrogenase family protein [Profundibacterium mesophilum]|uniref:Dihydrolipoamide dehydrogenase n=1 Tax=Profundibacterium mesophilum KAUST100406-0324 TaxID=1037889 RepID=A0A921TBS8_9RHOB|nr:FAD-dependent oxidoreductase [Profundibacterium mesophilum]KAF0676170.1 dihydrolipoamide dehydrogenase [Profundibacterium mesophilum KAUST100406-0324]